jgi:hypothetical protein
MPLQSVRSAFLPARFTLAGVALGAFLLVAFAPARSVAIPQSFVQVRDLPGSPPSDADDVGALDDEVSEKVVLQAWGTECRPIRFSASGTGVACPTTVPARRTRPFASRFRNARRMLVGVPAESLGRDPPQVRRSVL